MNYELNTAMLRKLFLLVAFMATTMAATAQNVLEVKDVSQPNDVYSSEAGEAAVIVRCHASIPLKFSSTMDKRVQPFRTDLQGSDSVYYIAFPTGNRYRGRILSMMSPGYITVEYALELQPKQIVSLELTDPNALVDAGCYREHRNRGVLEFKSMNYDEARNQFVVARQCSDVDMIENDRNIALVDSILALRRQGDQTFNLLDYRKAADYYDAMLALNPNDRYASERYSLCMRNFRKDCDVTFTQAEFYFNERAYDKAKELYQRVINDDCNQKALATDRLNYITMTQTTKKDHARVFTYEYRKDVPIGFSYGKYNMRKVGGFFSLDISSKVFDAVRSECRYGDEKFPEFNVGFGWTVKIANPVWIFFGPGFTGKMYYGKYKENSGSEKHYPNAKGLAPNPETDLDKDMFLNDPEERDEAERHINFASAISPVGGLCIKYSFFALRVSYQYRFTLQKDLSDFMGPQRLSVGFGVAF